MSTTDNVDAAASRSAATDAAAGIAAATKANVAELLRDAADRFRDKRAVIFHGRPITFGELDRRVDLTAGALAAFGVIRGDRVALLAGNVPEFIYALYGSMRAGAIACPLNVMLAREEIRYILADSEAKVAVAELPAIPALLSVRDRLPHLEAILVIGGPPAPQGTVSLEEALRHARTAPDVRTEPTDVAVIAYTAGTTAEPKGAMLTHANLMANLEQMSSVPALAQASRDVVLLALPLFHIYALNVVLGLTIKTGATAVLVERFEPRETLELVRRHGVTVLFGAPPMFQAWLALADAGHDVDLSGVRLAVSGAAALPPEVLRAFRERFGVTIWEGYGLTEAAPAVTTNALGPEARPGSIGRAMPGIEVKLVDEKGDEVEEGDPGEMLIRGPNVFAGYWDRPEASAEVLRDGWLRTGDVAVEDDDGYFYLVDRKKDLVIVSGFNVYPKEVEEAIERHPSVREAAVVGIPDDRTGEAVQAWVVPERGRDVTPEELLRFLEEHLARFKWPKDIRVVEELPHHVTGKVLRRALRTSGRSAGDNVETEGAERST